MNKATAKTLVSDLLDRNLTPEIAEVAGSYTVTVKRAQGMPVDAVKAAADALPGVTAKAFSVEFS